MDEVVNAGLDVVDDIGDVLLDGINQAKDASSLQELVNDGTSGSESLALVEFGDVIVDDGLDLVDGVEQVGDGSLDGGDGILDALLQGEGIIDDVLVTVVLDNCRVQAIINEGSSSGQVVDACLDVVDNSVDIILNGGDEVDDAGSLLDLLDGGWVVSSNSLASLQLGNVGVEHLLDFVDGVEELNNGSLDGGNGVVQADLECDGIINDVLGGGVCAR